MYDFNQALARSRASRERYVIETEINFNGEWYILSPGVFCPVGTNSTRMQCELLQCQPGTSFLEIGTGVGVIAISAARQGCRRIVATDIDPLAVENAQRNFARFGVEATVTAVLSDLFSGLDPEEKFDTIYWHSNNVFAPIEFEPGHQQEIAFVDPGYQTHRRFFERVGDHLTPSGHALLGLSSRAETGQLAELAREYDMLLVEQQSIEVLEAEGPIRYSIVEVVRRSPFGGQKNPN